MTCHNRVASGGQPVEKMLKKRSPGNKILSYLRKVGIREGERGRGDARAIAPTCVAAALAACWARRARFRRLFSGMQTAACRRWNHGGEELRLLVHHFHAALLWIVWRAAVGSLGTRRVGLVWRHNHIAARVTAAGRRRWRFFDCLRLRLVNAEHHIASAERAHGILLKLSCPKRVSWELPLNTSMTFTF